MKAIWKHSLQWGIIISMVTFVLAAVFSVVSTSVLQGLAWGAGMMVVLMIVFIGIIFDMMGIASASANETPFHAMAAEKVAGARHAIFIVRNADRFSNFCNDVVGDICGIISGTASALVVVKLIASANVGEGWLTAAVTVVFSGLISALTVGGKAIGKTFAIHYCVSIVLWIGSIFFLLEHRFGIRLMNNKKKSQGKRGSKRAARSNTSA